MPIYEFVCTACGTKFETILSSSDTSGVVCEHCRSTEVKKLISAPSLKVGAGASAASPPPAPGCGRSGFS